MFNVGLIDLKIGNLKSIIYILKKIPLNFNIYIINKNFKNFKNIDKLIIPGQGGSFKWIHEFLNLDIIKLNNIIKSKSVFGICIGKQIFFKSSEELNVSTLNFFNGYIKKFNFNNNYYKIPHIGWKKVFFLKKHFLVNNLNCNLFYFSHSFYLITNKNNFIYGLTKYKFIFPTFFIKNNIVLTQFHPEKSSFQGMRLFYNFFLWKS